MLCLESADLFFIENIEAKAKAAKQACRYFYNSQGMYI